MDPLFLHFISGVSFFIIGLLASIANVPNRLSRIKTPLRFCGYFGLVHATAEWIMLFSHIYNASLTDILLWVATVLTGLSFCLLFYAAIHSLFAARAKSFALPALYAITLAWAGTVLLSLTDTLSIGISDIVSRWLMGAPAAAFLGVTILKAGGNAHVFSSDLRELVPTKKLETIRRGFSVTAFGAITYAILIAFSDWNDIVPIAVLSGEGFQSMVGVSVQGCRALAAIAIAVSAVYCFRSSRYLSEQDLRDEVQNSTRRLQAAIRAADTATKQFQDYAEAASEWFWETDAEDRFKTITQGTRSTDTTQVTQFHGSRRIDVAAEETDNEKWRLHQDDLKHHRMIREFTYAMPYKDGSKRMIAINGKPVFGNDGTFLGYRGTGRDVTKQIELEQRNQAMVERMQNAFRSITAGIVISDRHGVIVDFNPAAEKMFGYTKDEILGQSVELLMPESHATHHSEYMENYRTTHVPRIIGIGRELEAVTKDGKQIQVHLGIGELTSAQGPLFIASITDLTKVKNLEDIVRRTQKMDAIGQLTGGIAHDFNNILGIAIGNLELSLRRIEEDHKVRKHLERALNASQRGASLTRRLLNFTRAQPVQTQVLDPNTVITELKDLIGRSLTSIVEVRLSLDPETSKINVDKGDLEDALINIAINARDAMPNGGTLIFETSKLFVDRKSNARFHDLEPGEYVQISISDSGEGMPAEVQHNIFDPFFTTKEQGKGTGLGLATVYGFVKRSKGEITVYSEQGLGTTFKIFLPASTEEGTPLQNTVLSESETPRGTERILIVDDEEDLAELASASLSELGYTTTVCTGTADALAKLQSDAAFDLLLSDVVMPGKLNGFELAEKARELRPAIRVLLMSGYTSQSIWSDPDKIWTKNMISKPYTNMMLATAVRQTLDWTKD